MNPINILIVCVALLGFLPLAVFLYKKKVADRILATGRSARARVFQLKTNRKANYTVVHYSFTAPDGNQYKGSLTTRPGQHRINEVIEVFYLPDNPGHNTVRGTFNSNWFLAFVLAIALAVLYMMYRLYEMMNPGTA